MTINLKESFEILLVTYNRKPFLESTLQQLLADNSPVKKVSITILDNCSTDGTAELIDSFCVKYPNIKHIRHTRNIGGNANIARAFELATHEYFWVLADDDTYDFTHWNEVEEEMEKGTNLIVVNRELLPRKKTPFAPAELIRLLTFVPAAIHRSDSLDEATMMNIYYTAPFWFSQLAAIAPVINHHKSIAVLSSNIVKTGENDNNKGLNPHRTLAGLARPYKMTFFGANYLKSLALFEDLDVRNQAALYEYNHKQSVFGKGFRIARTNIIECDNNLQNYTATLSCFSFGNKFLFLAGIVAGHLSAIFTFPYFIHKRKKINALLKKAQEKGNTKQ